MNKNQIILLFEVIFLILVSRFAISQEYDYTSVSSVHGDSYDYGSDDSYSDSDFYTSSDPNQWNYAKVDWDKVDFSRADLYESGDFYENIPDEGYSELDYTRVDYSKITDHSKIDEKEYFDDLGCSSYSLDRGEQKAIFSKGSIAHPNGNSVSIPGTYPERSLFIVTNNGIEVIIPQDTDKVNVLPNDEVTLDTQGRDITVSVEKFPSVHNKGPKINGEVSFQNGQMYVSEGGKSQVNDIEITAPYEKVGVYFDEDEHTGNYVSFGKQNVVIKGSDFDVVFNEGNEYVNMESQDRFVIKPLNDGRVSITRQGIESPTSVIVTGPDDEQEWAQIKNGNFNGIFGKDGVTNLEVEPKGKAVIYLDVNSILKDDYGNVPMEISVLDENDKNLIPSSENMYSKLIVTENKYLLVLNNGGTNKVSYLKNNYGPTSNQEIEFIDIDSWSDYQVEQISTHLERLKIELSPSLVESISSIQMEDMSPDGWAMGTKILLKDDQYIGFPIFAHETAHSYHYYLKFKSGQEPVWDQSMGGRYPKFDKEWYETQDEGDMKKGMGEYGKYIVQPDDLPIAWKEHVKQDEPKHGFVRSYGNKNIKEDVATYIEEIARTGTVPNLDDPNSKYYQKVKLLCKYGFLQESGKICQGVAG